MSSEIGEKDMFFLKLIPKLFFHIVVIEPLKQIICTKNPLIKIYLRFSIQHCHVKLEAKAKLQKCQTLRPFKTEKIHFEIQAKFHCSLLPQFCLSKTTHLI